MKKVYEILQGEIHRTKCSLEADHNTACSVRADYELAQTKRILLKILRAQKKDVCDTTECGGKAAVISNLGFVYCEECAEEFRQILAL